MRATGALPTEERVQKMNDYQWLWYYLNILEEEKTDAEDSKLRLDYLGSYINPDLARSVVNKENNSKYQASHMFNSSSFEEEMKAAMQGEEFVEVPDTTIDGAGNPNESLDDFLSRVENTMMDLSEEQYQEQETYNNFDDDDLDIFIVD